VKRACLLSKSWSQSKIGNSTRPNTASARRARALMDEAEVAGLSVFEF
jgi:hypothetical protein